VILDTEGNIFGGFTPAKWESGSDHSKADDSQKSFLFTLKNPHNVPPTTLPLKAEGTNLAILCESKSGPHFGDLGVCENSNIKTDRDMT
jgi:hypothetical protein